jgi:hypothetical protein
MQNNQNPLTGYFRQIQIYVTLPSQGRWYPPGNITLNDRGEVGIMPMTAKDELIMKTPDALMNGQATVDVIKSCVPDIKDPWSMPSVDVDTILLGIRLASYGESMDVTTSVPNTKLVNTVQVDLSGMLGQMGPADWKETFTLKSGLTIYTKPMTYRMVNKVKQKTYEEQRLLRTVTDSNLSEAEKLQKFGTIFATISELTVDSMSNMITKITMEKDGAAQEVTDRAHINEFVYNMDLATAQELKGHFDALKNVGETPDIHIDTTEEQQKEGGPKSYTTKIAFNNSDFFAQKY